MKYMYHESWMSALFLFRTAQSFTKNNMTNPLSVFLQDMTNQGAFSFDIVGDRAAIHLSSQMVRPEEEYYPIRIIRSRTTRRVRRIRRAGSKTKRCHHEARSTYNLYEIDDSGVPSPTSIGPCGHERQENKSRGEARPKCPQRRSSLQFNVEHENPEKNQSAPRIPKRRGSLLNSSSLHKQDEQGEEDLIVGVFRTKVVVSACTA